MIKCLFHHIQKLSFIFFIDDEVKQNNKEHAYCYMSIGD